MLLSVLIVAKILIDIDMRIMIITKIQEKREKEI